MASKRNQVLINEEVTFSSSEELISTTDLRGVVTYANEAFCQVAGYQQEELIGKNHNLVRHPDMPKAAFADLWQKLEAGEAWRGAVKNRCKDGRYYWVDAFVTAIYQDGKKIGYQSVRTVLEPKYKEKAQDLYQKINAAKWSENKLSHNQIGIISYLLLSILCIALATQSLWFLALQLVLPFICFYPSIFATNNTIASYKEKYDSVSKFVFSDSGPLSVVEYQMQMLTGKIKTILGRVSDANISILSRNDELSESSEKAKQGAEYQVEELAQVSNSVEQMVGAITDVAKSSEFTSQKAKQAQQDCISTSAVMKNTTREILTLSQEVEQSANIASELNEEAEKIGAIMQEIQGIADQTNLLALNAAIEAARAGEQGRGFSVVADEVRALSSRTHAATQRIESSVSEIQNTMKNWSEVMVKGQQAASHCIEEAKSADEKIQHLQGSIDSISDLATQIASAAEQQSMASQEITTSVENINTTSLDNLHQAEAVANISEDLTTRVKALSSLVDTFKN